MIIDDVDDVDADDDDDHDDDKAYIFRIKNVFYKKCSGTYGFYLSFTNSICGMLVNVKKKEEEENNRIYI